MYIFLYTWARLRITSNVNGFRQSFELVVMQRLGAVARISLFFVLVSSTSFDLFMCVCVNPCVRTPSARPRIRRVPEQEGIYSVQQNVNITSMCRSIMRPLLHIVHLTPPNCMHLPECNKIAHRQECWCAIPLWLYCVCRIVRCLSIMDWEKDTTGENSMYKLGVQ